MCFLFVYFLYYSFFSSVFLLLSLRFHGRFLDYEDGQCGKVICRSGLSIGSGIFARCCAAVPPLGRSSVCGSRPRLFRFVRSPCEVIAALHLDLDRI